MHRYSLHYPVFYIIRSLVNHVSSGEPAASTVLYLSVHVMCVKDFYSHCNKKKKRGLMEAFKVVALFLQTSVTDGNSLTKNSNQDKSKRRIKKGQQGLD